MSSNSRNCNFAVSNVIVDNELYCDKIGPKPFYCSFLVDYCQKLVYKICDSKSRHCVDITCALLTIDFKNIEGATPATIVKKEPIILFKLTDVSVTVYADYCVAMLPEEYQLNKYGISPECFPLLSSDLPSQQIYFDARNDFVDKMNARLIFDYTTHFTENNPKEALKIVENLFTNVLSRRFTNVAHQIDGVLPNFDRQLFEIFTNAVDWGFACSFAELFSELPVFPNTKRGFNNHFVVSKVKSATISIIKEHKRANDYFKIYVVGGFVQFDGNRLSCHCAINSIMDVDVHFANDDVITNSYIIFSTNLIQIPIHPVKNVVSSGILRSARIASRHLVVDHFNKSLSSMKFITSTKKKTCISHYLDCNGILTTGLHNMLKIKICHDVDCVHDDNTLCCGFKPVLFTTIFDQNNEYATFGQMMEYCYYVADINDNYQTSVKNNYF